MRMSTRRPWCMLAMRRASSWPAIRAALCLLIYLLAVALAWAQTASAPSTLKETQPKKPPPSAQLTAAGEQQRVREGTRVVDQLGVFKSIGGRVTFFDSESGRQFVGLENLNLERIAQAINSVIDRQEWLVSGTVTEFRGVNFLLVEKAVLREPVEAPAGSR